MLFFVSFFLPFVRAIIFLLHGQAPHLPQRLSSSIHPAIPPTCRPIANADAIHPTAKCYMHFMLWAPNPQHKVHLIWRSPQAGTRSRALG